MKQVTKQILLTSLLLVSAVYFMSRYHHLFDFTKEALGKYYPYKLALFGHIVPASIALLSGPFQFITWIRNRFLRLHRIVGRVYVVCILISIISALYLTFTTTSEYGLMYTISLWFLLFIWFSTTSMMYLTVRKRRMKEHKEWAVRSYITTFAFIIQNYILFIPGFDRLGSFDMVSPNVFWFSWSVPLFIYQLTLALKPLRN